MSPSNVNRNEPSLEKRKMIIFGGEEFERLDERNDALYYEIERPGPHLDSLALETVERVIRELVVEKDGVILDLMAGIDSHISESVRAKTVVGLGMNKSELEKNPRLTEYRLHDLNRAPRLPFRDNTFDVVLNTVSVDYMTEPFIVFDEVSRILKPGGVFVVVFSDRYFPQKAVSVWKESSEEERILLVEEYFRRTPALEDPRYFVSRGLPRPAKDKYSDMGIPSDPVYVLYAEKRGQEKSTPRRPDLMSVMPRARRKEDLEERKRQVGNTLRCPHCDHKLSKWKVPDNPFMEWDSDFMYICFNDECAYYMDGWSTMARQGNHGVSYRYMYNPGNGASTPIPVHSPRALKSGVLET